MRILLLASHRRQLDESLPGQSKRPLFAAVPGAILMSIANCGDTTAIAGVAAATCNRGIRIDKLAVGEAITTQGRS